MTYSILYFTEGQRDVMTLPKTRLQGRPESRHTVDPNPSQLNNVQGQIIGENICSELRGTA